MRWSILTFAAVAAALSIDLQKPLGGQDAHVGDQYLIEIAPGETRWITEDEKWELKRV